MNKMYIYILFFDASCFLASVDGFEFSSFYVVDVRTFLEL